MPILYAATMPDAAPGGYYGPDGFREMTGLPIRVQATPWAQDPEDAKRLWEASERLTGVRFPLS